MGYLLHFSLSHPPGVANYHMMILNRVRSTNNSTRISQQQLLQQSFWLCRAMFLDFSRTTSHSTLHFCGSSAIHPPSVKSIEWMVVEIIEGQTDRKTGRKTEIPCICSKINDNVCSKARSFLIHNALLTVRNYVLIFLPLGVQRLVTGAVPSWGTAVVPLTLGTYLYP